MSTRYLISALIGSILFLSCEKREDVVYVTNQSPLGYSLSIASKTPSLSFVTPGKSGDITILENNAYIEDDIVFHSFMINAPKESQYYLSVFIFPEDNSCYFVRSNNQDVNGVLKPTKTGWQAICLTDTTGDIVPIKLSEGKNLVQFYSSSNDFPEIEVLRMTVNEIDSHISTEEYDSFYDAIDGSNEGSLKHVDSPSLSTTTRNAVDYQYELDCPLLYSFTKTIVHNASGLIRIRFTSGSYPFYVDVFKDWVFTKSQLITADTDVYSEIMPQGTYTFHLRRYLQNSVTSGAILIEMNNQNYSYSSCPIAGYNYATQSDNYTGGIVNFFTCYNSSGTNPIMYMDDGPGNAIMSINDDYISLGDFDWGLNSRIKKSYDSTPLVHVFNATALLPVGTFDVYARIPSVSTSYYQTLFPLLQDDDTMLSGPYSSTYNCIGWAGDLTQYVWPDDQYSAYYYPNATTLLEAFDMYFEDRGYVRVVGQTDHPAIALWGFSDTNLTHASITKNSQSIYPHGYDWESKIGVASIRIFHEKEALMGNTYGDILHYYVPDEDADVITNETEAPVFHKNYYDLLLTLLNNTADNSLKNEFDACFDDWDCYLNDPSVIIHSNPQVFKSDISYHKLVSLCNDYGVYMHLLVIEKLVTGHFQAGFLLNDIIPQDFQQLRETAFHHYTKGMEIVPSTLGNMYRLAEGYLDFVKTINSNNHE